MPILSHAFQIFIIPPHLLIVHFLLYFSVKSPSHPAKNKTLLFFGLKGYGQINEPKKLSPKKSMSHNDCTPREIRVTKLQGGNGKSARLMLEHNRNVCFFSVWKRSTGGPKKYQENKIKRAEVTVRPAIVQAANIFTAGAKAGILSCK